MDEANGYNTPDMDVAVAVSPVGDQICEIWRPKINVISNVLYMSWPTQPERGLTGFGGKVSDSIWNCQKFGWESNEKNGWNRKQLRQLEQCGTIQRFKMVEWMDFWLAYTSAWLVIRDKDCGLQILILECGRITNPTERLKTILLELLFCLDKRLQPFHHSGEPFCSSWMRWTCLLVSSRQWNSCIAQTVFS